MNLERFLGFRLAVIRRVPGGPNYLSRKLYPMLRLPHEEAEDAFINFKRSALQFQN